MNWNRNTLQTYYFSFTLSLSSTLLTISEEDNTENKCGLLRIFYVSQPVVERIICIETKSIIITLKVQFSFPFFTNPVCLPAP